VTLPHGVSKDRCDLCLRVRCRPSFDNKWEGRKTALSDVRIEELQLKPADVMGAPPPPQSVYTKLPPFGGKKLTNSSGEVIGTRSTEAVIDFTEACPLPILGDTLVQVRQGAPGQDEKLFHFWFHAAMVDGPKLVLQKWQLDGPAKDRKHKKYSPHFRVELTFDGPIASGGAVPID